MRYILESRIETTSEKANKSFFVSEGKEGPSIGKH